MSETVYVLGAGVNKAVADLGGINPPLATEFFSQFLTLREFQGDPYTARLAPVLDYIQRYWRRDRRLLASEAFDIEEFFSLLDRQVSEATAVGDHDTTTRLQSIDFEAKRLVAELLAHYEHFIERSYPVRALAKQIWERQANVITFNYDSIIEQSIASESGFDDASKSPKLGYLQRYQSNTLTDHDIAGRCRRWHQPLGYGVKFDVVQLLGVPGPFTLVSGEPFYSLPDNQPYEWSVLKLHGSLNWFQYLPIPTRGSFGSNKSPRFPPEKENQILLMTGFWSWAMLPEYDGWLLEPLIVPPTLYKDSFFQRKLFRRVLQPIWGRARAALGACRHLVIVGYSFPPTDFDARRLFLEGLADKRVDTLTVVNPSDSARSTARRLCAHDTYLEFPFLADYVAATVPSPPPPMVIHMAREGS